MGELPRGTVTFLFTDIEGSTRLLVEVGAEEYRRRLAEHRCVLQDAFARHGGVEVDTQGDAVSSRPCQRTAARSSFSGLTSASRASYDKASSSEGVPSSRSDDSAAHKLRCWIARVKRPCADP